VLEFRDLRAACCAEGETRERKVKRKSSKYLGLSKLVRHFYQVVAINFQVNNSASWRGVWGPSLV
jgi:hypothetical protein